MQKRNTTFSEMNRAQIAAENGFRLHSFFSIAIVMILSCIAKPACASALINSTSLGGFLINTIGGPSVLSLRLDPFTAPLEIEAQGAVRDTLAHLTSGTWIVGRGEVNWKHQKVRIDAVQTIGLREVLGVWTSAQNEIFEFRTFNRLFRYQPFKKDGAVHLKLLQKLEYALTPDTGQAYSIFITDNEKRLLFGTLRVDGTLEADSAPLTPSSPRRVLLLTMYDSETGNETQKISLSPLLVK